MEKLSKRYFNPEGDELLNETITNAHPTGFIDFNRSRYSWAKNIYDLMVANTWTTGEVNTNNEKKNFANLTDSEKWMYKMIFAQLSYNDSVQSLQLVDFNKLVTNSMIKAALIRQSYEETLHSQSYAVLLDAVGNALEVFDLYKTDKVLAAKNEQIAENFARYVDGGSVDKILLSAVANQHLEGIYFMTSFGYIYAMGDKIQGSRDMIAFIARDEINTHLPLFSNIVKTIKKENNISAKTIDKVYEMTNEAAKLERDWGKYLLSHGGVMGITEEIIDTTVNNYANDRLKAIKLDPIFEQKPETNLQKLVKRHLNINETRSNFFETNVKAYSKNSLNMDDF